MKDQKIKFYISERIPTSVREDYVSDILKFVIKRKGKDKVIEYKDILSTNISKLEMSCLNYAESKNDYIITWYDTKMVNILQNISDLENTYLIDLLFSENSIVDKICNKHSRKLNPNLSDKIMKDIEKAEKKRDLLQYVGEVKGLKCRNCGSNRIAIDTKQTRASDEAETVYYTCANCQKKWRQ